ncbi:target of rapamycin complex 2 subunit MAPKAP1, partial [Trichonephila inaurata madagascariensis]
MAFFDDRKFLLSHIHHSFITCDDTGMCEMAMLNEIVTDKALSQQDDTGPEIKILDYYAESDLLETGQSYDIVSGMGFIGGHRHRSNTAQRLEKLKKDRQNQAKITHIHWKDCPVPLSEQELLQLFPKKDLSKPKEDNQTVKSALSEALEMFPAAPNNPFGEYARFDGRVNRSAPSKKILIYLTMLPPAERNYGMEEKPKLKPSVSNYCLKIAEETGEVDEDFPNLDANEYVGKFGFPFLALIERETKNPLTVTLYIEDDPIKFDVSSLNLSLRELADLASEKISVTRSDEYHIEKLDEQGIAIPLDSKLCNFQSLVFRLVFKG